MNKLQSDEENRLFQLKKEVTRRDFDRHASILRDASELPPELRSPAVMTALTGLAINIIILFSPQLQRGWDYVPQQALLFTSTDMVHLIASIRSDQEPGITIIKGHELMYVTVKLLLLYGYLEIVAQGRYSPIRLGMEFNTVAWCVLSEPLRRLLQSTRTNFKIPVDETHCSPSARQAFAELPLKFSNGVKIHGLLPGEQIEELFFQPGEWRRWFYFVKTPITANTMLMLTSNYVVAIREELKVGQGWILTYIPRSNIVNIRCQPGDLYDELIIGLKRENQDAEYRLQLNDHSVETWRLQWERQGGNWKDPISFRDSDFAGT